MMSKHSVYVFTKPITPMKKILILLASLCFFSVTSAALTTKQEATVQHVIDMLTTHGETIDQRANEDTRIQKEATILRQEFLWAAQEMVEYADDDTLQFSMFKEELLYFVQEYMQLKAKKIWSFQRVALAQTDSAILALQNNMWEQMQQGNSVDGPMQEVSALSLSLQAMIPFMGSIEGDRSMMTDSKIDMSRQIMETILAMDMDFGVVSAEDGMMQALKAQWVVDLKMPGNDMMYLTIGAINLDATQGLDDEVIYMMDQMEDLFANTYVSIPLEWSNNMGMWNTNSLSLRSSLNTAMTQKPMISFYHKEWNTYYWMFNHNTCDMMESLWMDQRSVNDCHIGIEEILEATDGKWPIKLTMNDGNYSISMHNFDGEMPVYFEWLDVLTRNDQTITKVYLPLDESWWAITYQNGEREMNFRDENDFLDMNIETSDDMMIINWTIMMDGVQVLVDGWFETRNQTTEWALTINVSQGWFQLGEFALEMNSEVNAISPFTVAIPTNVMTMEEFTLEMESRMIEYYQSTMMQ